MLLCTIYQCHRSLRTHDRDFQCFVMAAILEFKMATEPVGRPLESGIFFFFFNICPKIPLSAKFHIFFQK